MKSSETDRRVWVRHPSTLETVLQPASNGDESRFSARVRNVSLGGISLLVNRAFAVGELLSVELPMVGGQSPGQVLTYVVHASAQPGGEWALGCTFARELSDDNLQALGAKRLKAAPADQRGWTRFPCGLKASFYLQADPEQKRCPVTVLNISASGIGMLADRAITTGTLLTVEMQGSTGQPPLSMLACVVHVNAQEGQWALGCNFIRELTGKDLQALL